jgi:predicted transposase/invertase (TIGR01784 family)
MGIVDVKVKTKSGAVIDIEVQVADNREILGRRIAFYMAILITEQIKKSQSYDIIKKVICVAVLDWTRFEADGDYLNNFAFCEKRKGFLFDDIPEEIYTLELRKLPAESDGREVWGWLKFLRAREREEFEMIAERNAALREAVDDLYEISADERTRAQYEYRLKAFRDRKAMMDIAYNRGESQGLIKGKREGLIKGKREGLREGLLEGERKGLQKGLLQTARKMKQMGLTVRQIAEATGLSPDEITRL